MGQSVLSGPLGTYFAHIFRERPGVSARRFKSGRADQLRYAVFHRVARVTKEAQIVSADSLVRVNVAKTGLHNYLATSVAYFVSKISEGSDPQDFQLCLAV
jgi:hypothetical protein